jgi:hypothetical protein
MPPNLLAYYPYLWEPTVVRQAVETAWISTYIHLVTGASRVKFLAPMCYARGEGRAYDGFHNPLAYRPWRPRGRAVQRGLLCSAILEHSLLIVPEKADAGFFRSLLKIK